MRSPFLCFCDRRVSACPSICAFLNCRAKAAAQAKQQADAQAEKASQSILVVPSRHSQADGDSGSGSTVHLPATSGPPQQAVALQLSTALPEGGPPTGRAPGHSNNRKPSKQGRSHAARRQGHDRPSAAAGQSSVAHGKAGITGILEQSSSGANGRDLGKPRILEVRRPTRSSHMGPPGGGHRASAGSFSIASSQADKPAAANAEPGSQQLQALS